MANHGIVLPTRGALLWGSGSGTRARLAREIVTQLAVDAETLGFDSVWCGDSVTARPRFEPLVTLAAVAGATESVTLGTAVYLPLLRHPVHVAHQTTTLDLLSGGRLALGIGIGGDSPTDRAERGHLDAGMGPRGHRLDEALELLRGLWNQDELDYHGRFFELEGGGIGMRPTDAPPIFLASTHFDPREGFPEPILERFLRHGDGWLPISFSPEMYDAGANRLRAAVRNVGGDPSDIEFLYYQDVVIDESAESAFDSAQRFLREYYPWRLSEARIRSRGAYGPPEAIIDHLQAYEDAGVETFVTRFPSRDQREQLHRYAELIEDRG